MRVMARNGRHSKSCELRTPARSYLVGGRNLSYSSHHRCLLGSALAGHQSQESNSGTAAWHSHTITMVSPNRTNVTPSCISNNLLSPQVVGSMCGPLAETTSKSSRGVARQRKGQVGRMESQLGAISLGNRQFHLSLADHISDRTK